MNGKLELECRNCGLYTADEKIIEACNRDDETGNTFCPECRHMAIVTDSRE